LFGGVYQDEKTSFPQFVIDPENQRKVMTEMRVPDDQWKNFVSDRQGAIAGGISPSGSSGRWATIPLQNALYGR